MHRALVMFPRRAHAAAVDVLIEGIASSFAARAGFQRMTRSVGALMGPGATGGEAGSLFEADFASLGDALAALDADDFQDLKAQAEGLASAILLFEVRDV